MNDSKYFTMGLSHWKLMISAHIVVKGDENTGGGGACMCASGKLNSVVAVKLAGCKVSRLKNG